MKKKIAALEARPMTTGGNAEEEARLKRLVAMLEAQLLKEKELTMELGDALGESVAELEAVTGGKPDAPPSRMPKPPQPPERGPSWQQRQQRQQQPPQASATGLAGPAHGGGGGDGGGGDGGGDDGGAVRVDPRDYPQYDLNPPLLGTLPAPSPAPPAPQSSGGGEDGETFDGENGTTAVLRELAGVAAGAGPEYAGRILREREEAKRREAQREFEVNRFVARHVVRGGE